MRLTLGTDSLSRPLAVLPLVLLAATAGQGGCLVDFTLPGKPACGNGRIDSGEACDDGNTLSEDGCNDLCLVDVGWQCFGQPSVCSAICGDGIVGGLETCDDGNQLDGDGCSAVCGLEAGWACLGAPSNCAPLCGDEMLVGEEPCDGELLSVASCLELQLGEGSLSCLPDCTLDVTGCDALAQCGNAVVEYPEVCDGNSLAGESCQTQGYQTGQLACEAGCGSFDVSGCSGFCGDNVTSGGEVCDGVDLAGQTCVSQGFSSGTLACLADCGGYDHSACVGGTCGDELVGSGEVCDGAALAGYTCQSFGYYGGTLVCAASCVDFDLSGCVGICGDGTVNGSEACDGNALAGHTCATQGFDSGTLSCQPSCAAFDTSACVLAVCGNSHVDPGEECDTGGESATCDGDCTSAVCGDNHVNIIAGEQCDDGAAVSGDGCDAQCHTEVLQHLHVITTISGGWTDHLITFAGDPEAPQSTIRGAVEVNARGQAYVFTSSTWHLLQVPIPAQGPVWLGSGVLASRFPGFLGSSIEGGFGIVNTSASVTDLFVQTGNETYHYEVDTATGAVTADANNPTPLDWDTKSGDKPTYSDVIAIWLDPDNAQGWENSNPLANCGAASSTLARTLVFVTNQSHLHYYDHQYCFDFTPQGSTYGSFAPFAASGAPAAGDVVAAFHDAVSLYVFTDR